MSDKLKELRENSWSYSTGGGGGDVQADYNEIDPTSPAYIKNQPVGVATYILPHQTIKGYEPVCWGYDGNKVKLTFDETASDFSDSENDTVFKVTVVYDGVEYDLRKLNPDTDMVDGWGNPTSGIYNEKWDGEEPPIRLNHSYGDKTQWSAYPVDWNEHTISAVISVWRRLDKGLISKEIEEQINETYALANTQTDWDAESTMGVDFVKNRPFYKTKFIVPEQQLTMDDWETEDNTHYRAKVSNCTNAMTSGKGYTIDFDTFYYSVGSFAYNPGTAVIYNTPTEVAPFDDDYKITAKFMIFWRMYRSPDSRVSLVYADGYLYVDGDHYRLKKSSYPYF